MKTKSARKLLAVHCYGNRRDITSHHNEQHHQLAVELAGVDHQITLAEIPLCITSQEDDGPEVKLTEKQTLAITDEIARRCNLHDELAAIVRSLVSSGGIMEGGTVFDKARNLLAKVDA